MQASPCHTWLRSSKLHLQKPAVGQICWRSRVTPQLPWTEPSNTWGLAPSPHSSSAPSAQLRWWVTRVRGWGGQPRSLPPLQTLQGRAGLFTQEGPLLSLHWDHTSVPGQPQCGEGEPGVFTEKNLQVMSNQGVKLRSCGGWADVRGATGRMLSAQPVTQPGTHCSSRRRGAESLPDSPISVWGQLGAQTSFITPTLPGPRFAASS